MGGGGGIISERFHLKFCGTFHSFPYPLFFVIPPPPFWISHCLYWKLSLPLIFPLSSPPSTYKGLRTRHVSYDNKDFKIGRLRTTATVGRESGPGSSQTAHVHYHASFPRCSQSRSQSPRYPCPAERETRDSGTKRLGSHAHWLKI